MVFKVIYIIRQASLEGKPGADNRENELEEELGTGKEAMTSGEFLKTFLIHFEVTELHDMKVSEKVSFFLSFLNYFN